MFFHSLLVWDWEKENYYVEYEKPFRAKYKKNISINVHDIAKILGLNNELFDFYLQKWISEEHPKGEQISTENIYFRKGLINKNLEQIYSDKNYINSYTLSRTVSEQFATMTSDSNKKNINTEYGLFQDRILFFTPFIKGIEKTQIEIAVIPYIGKLEPIKQGIFGGIEEYILK